MITKACFIQSQQLIPYPNLALESHLMETVAEDTIILYLWQNQHTVVIGKNQNAWRECKATELTRDGGYLARRMSGGGAVFHDLGNLNFTFLVNTRDYDVDRQLSVILTAMRSLGLDAQKSGRNDITINGRKFSGNAFYTAKGKSYHHGTLLVDVNMDALSQYLNVDPLKLQSKGVASVKARVVNLTSLLPELTIEQLKQSLIQALGQVYGVCPQPLDDTQLDRERIKELTERYSSWEWLYGAKLPFTHRLNTRFPWGGVELQLAVDQGRITQAAVYSDAMDGELFAHVGEALTGLCYDGDAIAQGLEKLRADSAELRELTAYIKKHI